MVKFKELNIDMPSHALNYLQILDRGSLKWPTDFFVTVCSNTFLIFQNLLRLHEYESCKHQNQKHIVTELTFIFNRELYDYESCSCGQNLLGLMEMCLNPMANILLNNCTKIQNDTFIRTKNKRKLDTLI